MKHILTTHQVTQRNKVCNFLMLYSFCFHSFCFYSLCLIDPRRLQLMECVPDPSKIQETEGEGNLGMGESELYSFTINLQ